MDINEHKQFGELASQAGYHLPLQVMKSNAGFYLGTWHEGEGPISRESVEYWPMQADAAKSLETGNWTQRPNP